MGEINLKNYQIKLEALFKQDQYDEVILHCRHILQTYPKNVNVYRFLGRALVSLSRYDEAAPVLRRVLSVHPADYHAHLGLSQVNRARRDYPAAIWHLERAYEQDSNNRALLAELRDLYVQHTGSAPERLPLTARAVAEQQIRSRLYHRAIDTLRDALAAQPDRVDLELLLAQTYWQVGERIAAGERALNVLRRLPDALEANRIMTELWLGEQRPSDAQRYLGRVEAVGPYIAFQIAQGEFPPDDAFRLQELDYQREASRQLASDRPEWLESLTDDSDDFFGDTDLVAPDAYARARTVSEDESEDLLGLRDKDWMQEVRDFDTDTEGMTREVKAPAELSADPGSFFDDLDADADQGDMSWLAEFDDPTAPNVPTPARKATGLTGLLNSLEGSNEREAQGDAPPVGSGSGLTDLLGALEDEPIAASGAASTADDDFGADDADLDDPLAWMRDSGLDLTEAQLKQTAPLREPGAGTPPPPADAATDDAPVDDFNDPLAWMRGMDIEIVDEAADPAFDDPFGLEDDVPITDPGSTNPLAWMANAGVELVDGDDSTPPRRPTNFDTTSDLADDSSTDPLAWLKQSGVEIVDDDEGAPAEAWFDAPGADGGASPVTDSLGWLGDDALLDEMLQMEELSQTGGLPGSAPLVRAGAPADEPETIEDRQDIMADDRDNRPPDWLASSDDDAQDAGGLEWLDDEPDDNIASALDWMTDPDTEADDEAEVPPARSGALAFADLDSGASDFSWDLDDDDLPSDDQLELAVDDDDAVPDWLSGVGTGAAAEPSAEVPDWLSGVGTGAAAEPSAEVPDWLSGVGGAGLDIHDADDAEADDDQVFGWGARVAPEAGSADDDLLFLDDAPGADAEAEDEPAFSWLASATADDDEADELPVGEARYAFSDAAAMTDDDLLDNDDEALFALDDEIESSVPDWLTSVTVDGADAPASTASGAPDADDDAFELDLVLGEAGDDDDADEPAWLQNVGSSFDAEPVGALADFGADDDDDEVGDFALMFEADEANADDDEDPLGWMSSLDETPDEAGAFAFDALPDAPDADVISADDDDDAGSFSWLPTTGQLDLEENRARDQELVANVPDWLTGATVDEPEGVAFDALDDDDGLAAFGLDFEGDEADAADDDAEAVPAWLSGIDDEADDAVVADADEISLDFDTFDALELDDALDAPVAGSGVPVTEFMVGETGGGDDDAWFTAFDQDLDADEAISLGETADEAEYDFDQYADVLGAELPETVEALPADNAPAWLNEMVPGLDLDYADQDADEPIEAAYPEGMTGASSRDFAWLSAIVDQELAPPMTLPTPGVPAPAASATGTSPAGRVARFVMSRPPAWLRNLGARVNQGGAGAAKDDDLPPWLNLDDED